MDALSIGDGEITDAHIGAGAGIADDKLATITAAGKVANSATTATQSNIPGTIVLRDDWGDFAARRITTEGEVHSTGGGFRLPDNTLIDDASDLGGGAVADGSITAAKLQSSSPFVYSNADGFAVTGTYGFWPHGNVPVSGSGVRMMWFPGIAAFRAGRARGTEWDIGSVGLHSVAMGDGTTASGESSVALGALATASGDYSVALGLTNATGFSSVAMGNNSTASGVAAASIGHTVTASGDYSVALGYGAVTNNREGAFVYGDRSAGGQVFATAPNQFMVRAAGGTVFYSASDLSSGVELAPGGGSWSSLSDAATKENHRDLVGEDVLRKLAAMPIREWNYRTQDDAIRHVGPTAQDFHDAFGLGEDRKRINTIDADGIALAGVKALEARTRAQAERIEELERQVQSLRKRLEALEEAVLKGGR